MLAGSLLLVAAAWPRPGVHARTTPAIVDVPAGAMAPNPAAWRPIAVIPASAPAPDARTHPVAAPLGEVTWTLSHDATLQQLARPWGISARHLAQLNGDLDPRRPLAAGTALVVYRADPERPTRSQGAPNQGRLRSGVPMPEGPSWTLKPGRERVYGTVETVQALQAVLLAYGAHFPDATPVPIRDLSAKRGGKIAPHRSHQSGRDVDIGFVLDTTPDAPRRVNAETFDAPKNWYLLRSLIDRGQVQAVFTSGRAIRWMRAAAEAELGPDAAAPYFDLVSYAHGHGHHMHVRFACPAGHRSCRGKTATANPARPAS